MSGHKPPVISGRIPTVNEIHDLDDVSELKSLNLDPNERTKLADEYDHYPDCKWAVIEYKSRNLKDSVEQIQVTAERLLNAQRRVDMAIIVSRGMGSSEKHIFRRRGSLLYSKLTKTPVRIHTSSNYVEVQIYYAWEVDRQYRKYHGSLAKWVYK